MRKTNPEIAREVATTVSGKAYDETYERVLAALNQADEDAVPNVAYDDEPPRTRRQRLETDYLGLFGPPRSRPSGPPAPPPGVRSPADAGNMGSQPVDARFTWAQATAASPSSPTTPSAKKDETTELLDQVRDLIRKHVTQQPHQALFLSSLDKLERWIR